MPWNHASVYQALVKRGERVKESARDQYVVLYPQRPNCALLYSPTSARAHAAPVHLNAGRDSWRPDVFGRIESALRLRRRDNKGAGKESGNFDWYEVVDWDAFASGLGLPSRAER